MKRKLMTKTGTFLISTIFILFFSFTFLLGAKGEITTITRPYLGEYTAEKMTMDGRDLLPKFRYVRIELKENDEFLLTAKGKSGRVKQMKGKYSFDEKEGEIALEKESFYGVKKGKFRLEKGKIFVLARYGKHTLYIIFAR